MMLVMVTTLFDDDCDCNNLIKVTVVKFMVSD